MDLDGFWFGSNEGLCMPGTADFVTWSKGIKDFRGGAFCNDSDRTALEAFFQIAGGSGWTNSDGWRGDGLLEEWYGVSVDSQGRVTGLDLSGNGLEGRIAGNLGRLPQMTELRIGGNALSGRLPLSLSFLPALQEFHYGENRSVCPDRGIVPCLDRRDSVSRRDGIGLSASVGPGPPRGTVRCDGGAGLACHRELVDGPSPGGMARGRSR